VSHAQAGTRRRALPKVDLGEAPGDLVRLGRLRRDPDVRRGPTHIAEHRVVNRRAMDLMMRGMGRDQIEANIEKLRAGADEEAARELKLFFILQKLSQDLNVEVDEAELNGRIAMLAAQRGRRPEKLKQDMAKDGTLANLFLQMREQKAIDKVLETATIEEVDLPSEGEKKDGPAAKHDISVAVEDMAAFMTGAAAAVEARFPGTRVNAFGHLGDGNVHFNVRAPAGAPEGWIAEEGEAVSHFVYDLVTAAGGSISAEHGIGQMKRDELGRLAEPARLLALRAIKHALDPKNIMNPGKLVPPEPSAQESLAQAGVRQ